MYNIGMITKEEVERLLYEALHTLPETDATDEELYELAIAARKLLLGRQKRLLELKMKKISKIRTALMENEKNAKTHK
jgi:anti-sigma regulatory factor (Ser/Thr protein kinase)